MRILTQLKAISIVTISCLLVLAPLLVWKFIEFKSAKNNYVLINAIQDELFERSLARDQYFLYREEPARLQWEKKNEQIERLLRQADMQFYGANDKKILARLRRNYEESVAIFLRIVSTSQALNAGGKRQVYEEHHRRLYSQLLLKVAACRDKVAALLNAAAWRVEQSYRYLAIVVGLFAVMLAFATIVTTTHIGRLIRKRLAPLHIGARIVASGDLGYRLACGGDDEFSDLALSVNAMTDKLQAFTMKLESEIGERKQAEEMLRKLSIAVEQSPAAVVIADLEGNIQYANPRFSMDTGYNIAEVIEQNPRMLQSGQTATEIYLELWSALSSGVSWHGELLNKRKNGDLYWAETHVAPVKNAAGSVTHYVAISTDITERKRIEDALKASEFRWKFALESACEGVWDWDMTTNKVHFSVIWKNMLGYADNEIGSTVNEWEDRVHPDDKPRVLAETQACLDDKTPIYASEYRMRCKDESWKWILARGMVISRNASGRALRMIGTHADIAERKTAEQTQVHKIVTAAPDPMFLISNDGMIMFANCAAELKFGYALNELTALNVDKLVPPESRQRHAFSRQKFVSPTNLECARHPCPSTLELPLVAVCKDGSYFPVEISLSSFQMDGRPAVIASVRDITERRRAAALLQQSFAELRRLSDHQQEIKEDERKRIAQDIHDDLGQNLLALKMDVDTLHMRTRVAYPKLNKRVAVVLDNINATIHSVKSIINDLRPATLELGLYPAVEWQLKQFERSSGVVCTLAPIMTGVEFGLNDAKISAIFRILQESLANVARHAKATSVKVAISADQRGFSMTVIDNGQGLQPGDRQKANSFGLRGIKERIDSLGGELIITSSPGQGVVLSIFIAVENSGATAGQEHATIQVPDTDVLRV